MTFIHGYLLGGLVLAGVPVLLHLIMRQKPKRLPFPAFRFLKARQRTNQRRMRLQHLLLLLLRVLVVVALCLALARPRLFSQRISGAGGERAVTLVLLFDTSPSMEYAVSGVSRLEDSQQRARELLDGVDAASRVAILDSGDDAQEALLPASEARARVEALHVRPGATSLNRSIDRALRMLALEPGGEESPPRFLYVFSDRTRGCWDAAGLKPVLPEGVNVLFVDVGVEKPRDLGIDKVEVIPPVAAPGARLEVRVSVRGTPDGHENELSCQIDNDPDVERAPDRRPVQLSKDQTGDVFVFERKAPIPPANGPLDVAYQVTVKLGTRDAMPFNNQRHATFLVRGGRKLLTVVDKGVSPNGPVRVWQAVQSANRSFASQVKTTEQVEALSAKELAAYPVVALYELTTVPDGLAKNLTEYVRNGGSLAIVPAGEDLLAGLKPFNDSLSALLPAPLLKLASAGKKPVLWERFHGRHPLLAPFVAWIRQVDPDFARDELWPFVRRYWQLDKVAAQAAIIATYADTTHSPALAERTVGKGKVLLFTTPLDVRPVDPDSVSSPQWTNYWESSFGVILIDRVCLYLAGETTVPELNFRCGQVPQVNIASPLEPPYTVTGPGLAGAERNLKTPEPGALLAVPQALAAGNYLILDGKGQPAAGFSLNVGPAESDLERVPIEELEEVIGKGKVLPVGHSVSLGDELAKRLPPPLELLPYLMIALLLVLTLESLLANRFYRRAPQGEGTTEQSVVKVGP